MHAEQQPPVAEPDTRLRLRDPAHQVSPRAKAMWLADAAIGWVVLLVLEALAAGLGWLPFLAAGALATVLVVSLLAAAAHLALMPRIRYRIHRWESTGEAVYTRSGWLSLEWRIAPISRIQTVDTRRRPVERIFGLSSVTVTTASAAGPVVINGLDREVAQRLSDELTATTAASRGDAT